MRKYIGLFLLLGILTGCTNTEVPNLTLEENQQLIYLYEDAYAFIDTQLTQNPNFIGKTFEAFSATFQGDFNTALSDYLNTYQMIDAKTKKPLSISDYEAYKGYHMTVFDVLGSGYTTHYSVAGKIVAIGSDASDISFKVKDSILEANNTGENALVMILYKHENISTVFKDIKKDHAYYELAHNGDLRRFSAYILEDELLHLGNDITLAQVVDSYYEGNYDSFAQQVSLIYISNKQKMKIDDMMQHSGTKLEVIQPQGRRTYLHVPGELLYINEEALYEIEGDYLVIHEAYVGDIMVGYYEVEGESVKH